MSEMDYEPMPEVRVPVFRGWFTHAGNAWTDAFYPKNRRGFVVWGWLFWLLIVMVVVKFAVWVLGMIVLLLLAIPVSVTDLCTYRRRVRDANVAAWAQYLEHGETA